MRRRSTASRGPAIGRAKLAAAAGVAAAALALAATVDRGGGPAVPGDVHEAGDGAPAAGAQSGQSALLWALGDGTDGGARSRRLLRQLLRERPDRFLYLGDVYPHGTARDFRRNYHAAYGPLARITDPTPGNHDWINRRHGYRAYWRQVKRRRQPDWYGYRLAGWEILSLNSQAPHGRRSPQLRWLRGRLRTRGGDCRLAFWHRPRYSAGLVHGDAPDTAPLWDALRGRARLVLGGHEHNLQRLRRRHGITEYVVGAGGRPRYPLHQDDHRLAWGRADRDGALRIELRPGRATLELRDATGRTLDRSRLRCRQPGQAQPRQR